jgi:hypothetical protein
MKSKYQSMIVTGSRHVRNATIKSMLMRGEGLEGGRREEHVTSIRWLTMWGRTQKEKEEEGRGMIWGNKIMNAAVAHFGSGNRWNLLNP